MKSATFCVLTLLAGGLPALSAASPAALAEADYRALPNLVANPSFEMDWTHNQVTVATRFQLLEQSDWGYGQSDGLPDCWVVPPTARLDPVTARFGQSSLRLQGAAWQVVYLLGETDPRDGGAHYNRFLPLPLELAQKVRPRPLRIGAWCKTDAASTPPTLTVDIEYGSEKPRRSTVPYAAGTHDWEYQEITLPADLDLGAPHAAVVRLTYQGKGTVWFDGVRAEEAVRSDEVNLVANPGFESLAEDFPAEWSRPVLWSWSRREYYRFTGWSHEEGRMVGGALPVPMGHSGSRSLQLTVLPGDNLAVKSQPITLNQTEARPLEVAAWVKADNLRWLEIMAQDEKGNWLPQQDFAGFMGTDAQYHNRAIGLGSHDWEFVRKHFVARQPVRELTLWLCARGFDGKLMQRYLVGNIWFDDVELRERGVARSELEKRGVRIPRTSEPTPSPLPFRVVNLDLGERLWERNELRLHVQNPAREAVQSQVEVSLIDPAGHSLTRVAKPITLAPLGQEEVAVPYDVTLIATDWQKYYSLLRPWRIPFHTPTDLFTLRLNGSYFHPDEKVQVGINPHFSRAGLLEAASCRVVVRHPKGEKPLLETDALAKVLWTPDQERPALLAEGYVDAKNLIALSLTGESLPRHAYDNPVRDCRVVVTLKDREGKVIATQQSEPFGFLERPPEPTLPDKIERTEVVAGGTIRINGQPYIFNCFPRNPTDLGSVGRLLNFPKAHKILALPFPKELIFGPDEEPDWKQKVQAFVRANKDDPKLFGYFFDHNGETSFWFDKWQEMAACQRKVAGWVREIDANHILLSATWLFGHTALTPEAAKHFDFLDELDVEPGLTWTPDCHAVRRAAGRPVAVVAGLECYYFQPERLLRWRTYEALRQGANGIGICPSQMLRCKPEIVSYLRGLYGEVQGLQAMLTGRAPAQETKADRAGLTVWERQDGKTRYVVAQVGERRPDEPVVTFTLPAAGKRIDVLFEDRTLAVEGGHFTDRFGEPYTVRVYRWTEE